MQHRTFSSDLAPSDFLLFGLLKEVLGRNKFKSDNVIKHLFNNIWTSNQLMKLPERWRRCVGVQEVYVVK
jgi:hypothetical protein